MFKSFKPVFSAGSKALHFDRIKYLSRSKGHALYDRRIASKLYKRQSLRIPSHKLSLYLQFLIHLAMKYVKIVNAESFESYFRTKKISRE